jgi:hypothetical protein
MMARKLYHFQPAGEQIADHNMPAGRNTNAAAERLATMGLVQDEESQLG